MKKWISSLMFILMCIGCEKEQDIPATLVFKTGTGYTSQDLTITKGSSLTVGIIATRSENNLRSYNVSVSYDGANTTITVQNFSIPANEKTPYEKDVNLTVRSQPGTEKYYFTIVDVDGNIVQKTLKFIVE